MSSHSTCIDHFPGNYLQFDNRQVGVDYIADWMADNLMGRT